MMNREEATNWIRSQFFKEATGTINESRDLVRTAVGQGFMYGFGDEAEAYARSVLGDKTYEENIDQIRKEIAFFRERNPRTAISSEIIGSLPTSYYAAVKLGKYGIKSPALIAGIEGFVYGAGTGEDAGDRVSNAFLGTLLSSGITKFFGVLSRTPDAKKLMDEGIDLTIGQQLGGATKKLEDISAGLPFSGQAVINQQSRGLEQFNKLMLNKALQPISRRVDDSASMFDAHAEAQKYINNAYEAAVPNLSIDDAPRLIADIDELVDDFALPENIHKQVQKYVKQIIKSRVTSGGTLSGESIKKIEADLGAISRSLLGGKVSTQREVGNALFEVQTQLRNELMAQNPNKSKLLQDANRAFKNLLPVTKAINSGLLNEGNFTAGQLLNAIKSTDSSVRRKMTASGQGELLDLALAAQNTMGKNMPTSGTTERLLGAGALLGQGYYVDPATMLLAPAIQRSIYSDFGQRLGTGLLNTTKNLGLIAPSIGAQSSPEEGLLGNTLPFYR